MAERTRGVFSRRRFVRGGAAGAAALYGLSNLPRAEAGVPSPEAPPFRQRGRLGRRPNFLVILADEVRFPPVYESQQTKQWRATYLTAEEQLRANGLEFRNHYVMSAACAPSRASLLTGHYPSLHGTTQTTGAAKQSVEHDTYWLDPATVPTLGDYFRAAGYDTYYKGKWHVSEADIFIPGTHDPLPSYDANGNPDPKNEQVYLAADRLKDFGFGGWIGPEPHGTNPLNSGSSAGRGKKGRDAAYAGQTVELLQQLQKGGQGRPWLAVCSFVNPHDITIWGDLTLASGQYNLLGQLEGTTVPDQLFDPAMYAATSGEDLVAGGKPACQKSYVDGYGDIFQPIQNNLPYRKFYYQLQQTVNGEIQKVLDALKGAAGNLYQDTIVIFTSDHGDLLGAHGGMHQKWHQAYEESVHVPFIVHNPLLFPQRQATDALTSHADLIPTLLGLAGLDAARLQQQLAQTHDEVRPLVGRDLSGLIVGEVNPASITEPVYVMTDDEVSRGDNQVSWKGTMYASVVQPDHVETVVANLPTGSNGASEKWKYSRYFDTPQFWSDPNTPQDVVTLLNGPVNQAGPKTATTTVKTTRVPDQIEAYNVTRDPTELTNLAGSSNPTVKATLNQLATLLEQQCAAKRLEPRSGDVPGQLDCSAM
jgi:choline-sulfatase